MAEPQPQPQGHTGPAAHAVARAEQQAVLFAERPRRAAFSRLEATWPLQPLAIRVHRNQPFEFIEGPLKACLAYAGYQASVEIGDYDDSLAFTDPASAVDVELVWLDYDRYRQATEPEALLNWLLGRLAELRQASRAPILVADWAGEDPRAAAFNERLDLRSGGIPGLHVCAASQVRQTMGDGYLDTRFSGIGATRISEAANLALARRFGLEWIPAAAGPRLKAVVFDLDNTLWSGVLGEDGAQGIVVDEGHVQLQQYAGELGASGLFLGLLSRNEPTDVQAAFGARHDIAITLEDFDATEVSWTPKAEGLARIAEALRIDPGAMLFVDDNPGELAAAAAAHPQLRTLMAGPAPEDTLRALRQYPGLFTWGADETDALRSADLAAARARPASSTADAAGEYLADLGVTLQVSVDPAGQRARLHQLSVKTNQFNLALRRFSEAEVSERLADPATLVIAIRLSDRLSDSGLIAAIFTRLVDRTLVVEELCVSCRALGRGVEDQMITAALLAAAGGDQVDHVQFRHETGPRNQPALEWLKRFSGVAALSPDGAQSIAWQATARREALARQPVRIVVDRD